MSALRMRPAKSYGTLTAMEAVTAAVLRRTGDAFVAATRGLIAPLEPIKLYVEGVVFLSQVQFIVTNEAGEEFLNTVAKADASGITTGKAGVYWQAPAEEGAYTLLVKFQTIPFFTFTSQVRMAFTVTSAAPSTPKPPPEDPGFFDNVKDIAKWAAIGGIAVAGVVVASRLLPKR
ncbi:MAG: hypothetical protein Q8R28_12420 [Dehalococcoidia bacterium]|nr:hypothetical protein [Dehalococcoidia bacterium]